MSIARRPGGGSGSSVARRSGTGAVLANRPEWVGVGKDSSAFVADRGNQSAIHLTATAQDHVRAYLEYERIVGDADGGVMFTPEEYEEFRRNAIAHRANRIYVAWRNMRTGMDCRQIGPTSPCFCGHRYRQHATDNHDKNIFCRQAGCACTLYTYVPIRGSQDIKCTCKHSYELHRVTGARKCKQAGCACGGFHSSASCSCRDQFGEHATVFETREERLAQGRPVDNLADGGQGYEAMGGITSFSSLIDGVDRMQIAADGRAEFIGAPPGWNAQTGRIEGPAGGGALPAPQRKEKLTEEDELALYDAKYKKGGSMYSAVSRPRLRPRQPPPEAGPSSVPPPASSSAPYATSASTAPPSRASHAARPPHASHYADASHDPYASDPYDRYSVPSSAASAAAAAPPPRRVDPYTTPDSSFAASSSAYPPAAPASRATPPQRGHDPYARVQQRPEDDPLDRRRYY